MGKEEGKSRRHSLYTLMHRSYSPLSPKTRANGVWLLPFTFGAPSDEAAFLFTVVASALFCLCCRYWAFCFQTCTEHGKKSRIQTIRQTCCQDLGDGVTLWIVDWLSKSHKQKPDIFVVMGLRAPNSLTAGGCTFICHTLTPRDSTLQKQSWQHERIQAANVENLFYKKYIQGHTYQFILFRQLLPHFCQFFAQLPKI